MEQKRRVGFGFRGWLLITYQAIVFMALAAFTNFPQNLLADMYGGASVVSTVYTAGVLLGVAFQLVLTRTIGRVKSVKRLGLLFGGVAMATALGLMLIPPAERTFWLICFGLASFFFSTWCTFMVGILVGQWFPRRKGTVMGISSFAFPITGGILLSVFAANVFEKGVFAAYLPFFIVSLLGILISAVFLKDYPEQCGGYRDNDRTMTAAAAQAMMEAEVRAKAHSVWTLRNTLRCRDFWFIVLPESFLLLSAVGVMVQIIPVLAAYGEELAAVGGYPTVLTGVSLLACFGSWLLGVIDTKIGTKKAIVITCAVMLAGGILGSIPRLGCVLGAAACLSLYSGASSIFTVSGAAQYWRREDFPNVFAVVNPIANSLQATGPMLIALIAAALGYRFSFGLVAVLGLAGLVLILLFDPRHVKAVDDRYRAAAGKPLDDELSGRK